MTVQLDDEDFFDDVGEAAPLTVASPSPSETKPTAATQAIASAEASDPTKGPETVAAIIPMFPDAEKDWRKKKAEKEAADVENPPAIAGRVPPHDLDAEAAILSAVLLRPDGIDDVGELKPEEFYAEAHRRIFEAIRDLRDVGQPIDVVTVASRLKDRQRLAQVGGMPYLGQILDCAPVVTTTHLEAYVRRVRLTAQVRELALESARVFTRSYGKILDYEAFLEEQAENLRTIFGSRQKTKGLQKLGPVLKAAYAKVVDNTKKPDGSVGLKTGLRAIDDATSGLHDGDVTVVGARPGMGKSSLILDIAKNVAVGVPRAEGRVNAAAIFSLEMPNEQLAQRYMALTGGIDMLRIRRAMFTPRDWERLASAGRHLMPLEIYLDDTPEISIEYFRTEVRKKKAALDRQGVDLRIAMIDFVQLMRMRDPDNLARSISEVTKGLKKTAKELEMHVMVCSQLNRGVEGRANKRPVMSDLKESGGVEENADNVLLLYRDEYYDANSRDQGVAEVIVAKQRNGPTGTLKVGFEKESARFHNLDNGDER